MRFQSIKSRGKIDNNYVIASGISDDTSFLLLEMINEESDVGIETCSFIAVAVVGVTAEDDGAVLAVATLGLMKKKKTN